MYCGQTVGWIIQIGLGPGHIVLDGAQRPLPQSGTAPQFLAHTCCGQMAGWIKMPLGIEVGLGPSDFVLPSSPSPKGGKGPQFSAVYCGQTVGWIKMALRMEVGLGPGHNVLDGDPPPPFQRGNNPSIFGQRLLWPNGWNAG